MRRITALFVYLATIATAGAAIDNPTATFVSQCTDDHAAGFSWKNDAWAQVSFAPTTYIVQKRSPDVDTACGDQIRWMRSNFDPSAANNELYAYGYACYNIRPWAAGFSPFADKVCSETWALSGTAKTLARVDCEQGFEVMSFAPDGDYNYAHINGEITEDPATGGKDSLIVSVGKCAVMGGQQ